MNIYQEREKLDMKQHHTFYSSPKNQKHFEAIPDSFRVYRGGQQDGELTDSNESNMSSTGSTCSSCSSFSDSCSGSDFG